MVASEVVAPEAADKAVEEPLSLLVEVTTLVGGQIFVIGRLFTGVVVEAPLKLPPREELVNIRLTAELYNRKSDFDVQVFLPKEEEEEAVVLLLSISLFEQNDEDGDGVKAVAKGRKRKEEEDREANADSKGILPFLTIIAIEEDFATGIFILIPFL